jgi:ribosome assembly protein YihI (activator of Der GTPase)
MPSHSPAQARMMAAAAHDPKFAKKMGIPVSVAQDYNQADKGKRLAEAMKSMDRKNKEGG